MAVQIFRLRNVPDDEAEEIRELLSHHHIDHYETPAGNWGISMPAIWINNDEQHELAKSLIKEYQAERLIKARNEYKQAKRDGIKPTIFSEMLENPLHFILYFGFVAVILYFSIKPFLNFGR